ncbi:WAT1-related protein, partial [Ananas comosus]
MVVIQILVMGMLILSKIVMNNGMQPYVLLGYRNIVGAIFVAPFAFFFERFECREYHRLYIVAADKYIAAVRYRRF